jgi:hypothetical protein
VNASFMAMLLGAHTADRRVAGNVARFDLARPVGGSCDLGRRPA